MEVFKPSGKALTNDFELTNDRDIDDMRGFGVQAYGDMIFACFSSTIEMLAIEEVGGVLKLFQRRRLLRTQCMFTGGFGQVSFHSDTCAIISQAVPRSDQGGILSLYDVESPSEISERPRVQIHPRRLPLFVQVVVGVDKIFTQEFCMRIMFGNEYEIVVRSLARPLDTPLFVLKDGLVDRPETRIVSGMDLC